MTEENQSNPDVIQRLKRAWSIFFSSIIFVSLVLSAPLPHVAVNTIRQCNNECILSDFIYFFAA